MPANIIIAETGGMWNVTGKSKEIAPAGPIPGRTPTNVPIRTPIKQYRRLIG
jgi:hypothetical protein